MLSVRKRKTRIDVAQGWREKPPLALPQTIHDDDDDDEFSGKRKASIRRRLRKRRRLLLGIVLFSILSVGSIIAMRSDSAKHLALHLKLYLDRAWFALERWGWLEEIHGFDTTLYHDRYPQLKILEDNFAVIQDELTAVLASGLDQIPVAAKIHNYKSKNFQYERTPWKERE